MTTKEDLERYVTDMEKDLEFRLDVGFKYWNDQFVETLGTTKLEPEYKPVIDKYNSIRARAKELGVIK